ncbi:hypothetical protein K1T71_014343 [Dendrolimus kikuchii]|uniref:Uncharacterized protein n=1 Tax=Dendrolimus kikuchii TaxID=765133 RepID=A0ACC1CE06_9NEOP|nr:hypothetical protein K1T71_014343 [Dendrolimus kikuchii]
MAVILHIFLITFLFTEALTWTIDLPEIRKFIFEKNQRIKGKKKENREDISQNNVYYYDNKDGNSLHHAESEKETPQYAEEYGYQPYMEKKVHSIVHKGGIYLEELGKSIEGYINRLQNCTSSDFSLSANLTNSTWQPQVELPGSLNLSRWMSCEEVTRSSEHVRRLADLATLTTRELQDIGYSKQYQMVDYQRENELILKLAWFLDRLAHYTGYDPDPKRLTTERPAGKPGEHPIESSLRYYSDDRNTQPPPSPITLVNSSEEVKNMMMNCLTSNSTEAAVDRCSYPFPIPPILQEIFSREYSLPTTSSPSNMAESVLPVTPSPGPVEPISDETQELLITADNRPNIPPYLTAVKQKSVRKRSAEEPIVKNLNTKKNLNLNSNTDVKLDDINIKKVFKRSLVGKKLIHLRLPENPTQNLGDYVKSKATTHFNKNNQQFIEIKNYLDKINHKKSLNKNMNKKHIRFQQFSLFQPHSEKFVKSLHKRSLTYAKPPQPLHIGSIIQIKPVRIINKNRKPPFDLKKFIEKVRETKFVRKLIQHNRPKRSTALSYREMEKPGTSENPTQDISYYVKNKPTTNENPSLTQAVQARLALEQHFATGNILVIRQFGANYNPLVPNAFYFGFMRTLADS